VSRRTPLRRRAQLHPTPRERARLFLPFRSWRLQLLAVALAVAAAIASAQSFAAAREASSYLIQPGDTLLGIATSNGIAPDRLISLNGITNPDFIVAGQTLALDGDGQPGPAPATLNGPVVAVAPTQAPAGQAGTTPYTVKTGDTLWDISQATGVTLESLIKLNNLNDADALTVGQTLRLPAGAVIQQSASSGATPRATPAAAARPKPSPSPSPAAAVKASPTPQTSAGLAQRMAAEATRIGGARVRVGAAATNLVTGEKILLRADEEFPSASVMKLPILVELERQIAAGTLAWSDSLRAEASAMISVSDNTAANQIAGAIHPKSVNDTMARLGLSGTRFFNLFSDSRSSATPGMNQTTPANMARLLELVATDQIVSPQVSADIRTFLSHNTDRSKLARLLPADAAIAHKSGWYDGVANDVGIVTVDRVPVRWTIAVFSENIPDAETGNQIVAAMSKLVYDAWGK
jgi:beta-lactamase class A